MKKSYLFIAAAALFAACSSDSLTVEKDSPQNPAAAEQAVNFGAYVGRGTTRAGLSGELNNDQLQKEKASKGGFGVFGYYTDGERYAGNTKPNFFYNQGVFYNSTSKLWEYSPIKYWPNEFGTDAISDQVDRVTLFAYAPFVEVDPLTGFATENNTENITALTRNNATGDPYVRYTATMDPTNSVDLCYAVAAEDFNSSNSTSFPNNIKKGKPYLDVTKPGLNGKIKFDFKHALAKLNVQIDYDVNEASHGTKTLDAFTKIWVRSVTFEGITLKGALNLNSGEWYQVDASGDTKISTGTVTVYDGLKDGKEPMGKAANESPASLNRAIIQSLSYDREDLAIALQTTDETKVTGVTSTAQNLFAKTSSETEPIFVIPTGEPMKVTIVYDVETYDSNLAYYLSDGMTPGSTIQNTITKTINSFTELKAGLAYTLKLHLGMRSVDFDATVSKWEDVTGGKTDLPSNLPTFTAIADKQYDINVPAGTASFVYDFALSGLKANEGVTGSIGNDPSPTVLSGATSNPADGEGIANQQITIAKNTTTKKRVAYAAWTGSTTGKTVLKFTQSEAPLGLKFAYWYSNNNIFLECDAATTSLDGDLTKDADHIKVWKNNGALVYDTDFSYSVNGTRGQITLKGAAVATSGDIYKVEIKSGDASAESVVITYTTAP